ncbi:MAG: ribonuclease III [Dehalococcoidia bacterium]|nr:ribonuclease III [Dehalococcoidia bacterium]MSQ17315.1 ribonuclease III [Dehalococcoidia bacterium]
MPAKPSLKSVKSTPGPVEAVQAILGVQFKNPELLRLALVHRSFLNEAAPSAEGQESYERLEFLGDAVLGLVISTELYTKLPHLLEGDLTKRRATLVCRESLAEVARRLTLGDFLMLGRGEEASGGRRRDTILAAAFESVVAAVYLDRGYAAARRFILRVMRQELDELSQEGEAPPDNPKSQLQELLQGQGRPAPHYRLVASQGPDHSPTFTIEVLVQDQVIGQGQAGKKSDAERAAARDALGRLLQIEKQPGLLA